MSRRAAGSSAVVAGVAVLALVPVIAAARDVVVGDAYARHFQHDRIRFDGVQQVLLSFPYRGASDCTEPAVAWAYVDDGRAGGLCPLKDFPEAYRFDVWDVAAGPRSVVVSGIVQAGEEFLRRPDTPPKHVILTYDLTGTLRHGWSVNPYHLDRIAVDTRGNVYALGHRMNGPTKNVMLQYSPEGVAVRDFFPIDLLPGGVFSVLAGGLTGENQLWLEGQRLLVYLARPQELFEFDLDGILQQRTSLRASLAWLAKIGGGTRAVVMALVGDGRGRSLLAQVHISGKTKISFALARLSLDGGPPTVLEPTDGGELGTMQVPLIGSNGDSTLFLNRYTATILQR